MTKLEKIVEDMIKACDADANSDCCYYCQHSATCSYLSGKRPADMTISEIIAELNEEVEQ